MQQLHRIVTAEVGACQIGAWEPYKDLDGSLVGWMTTVAGEGTIKAAQALTEA